MRRGKVGQRVAISVDHALGMLDVHDPGRRVHVIAQAATGGPLVGGAWDLADVEFAMREHGVELAGQTAQFMDHGLVVVCLGRRLFLATKPEDG